MYTAAVLTRMSALFLRQHTEEQWQDELDQAGFQFATSQMELPHHMTLNLGPINTSLNNADVLGKEVVLYVSELVLSKTMGVCAAIVSGAKSVDGQHWLKSANRVPHITICLANFAKPKHSNDLLANPPEDIQRVTFGDPLSFQAFVRECQ